MLPPRVRGLRDRTANVAGDNSARIPQLRQRPEKIDNREAAVLPICRHLVGAKTIEVDRNVNINLAKILHKHLEMFAPILAQNCPATLSIFQRALIRPRMHFEFSGALGEEIPEKQVRPPAFKISAAPNADALHVRQFQRPIYPTAATPFRRTHIPIRVIVERNNDNWPREAPNPKRAQKMKVA